MNTSRGRPVDVNKQQEQKLKLIIAAQELLDEKSYRSLTIREIAQRAGVNSALIRYYFESKEGLFIALFEQMATEHFALMATISQSDTPIRAFITIMLDMLNEHSGFARFLHDEIMAGDSSLQFAFVEKFPKRMAIFLPDLIKQQIEQGNLAENTNTKYAAFSLMSLIITPFVTAPIRESVWKISSAELASPHWSEHIFQLFMSGYGKRKNNE